MVKTALITGIGGQDGSYLAAYLLKLGYRVHGTVRRNDFQQDNLPADLVNRVRFHYADLRDELSLEIVMRRVHPDEIYNLAGQTFVPPSWTHPAETFDVNVGGLARILKMVDHIDKKIKVYQASSSEMFGNLMHVGQRVTAIDETAPMVPVSPYGASKLAAHKLVDVYRQRGLFVVSGILFNHESPRRGAEMVTRKITRHIARWAVGDLSPLELGNVHSARDWGFAGDYVKAMHAMLQIEKPDDYVIGTGHSHTVMDFLTAAVGAAGLPGELLGPQYVKTGSDLFARPDDLHCLVADYTKAKTQLTWYPETSFEELVHMMVDADVEEAKSEVAHSNRIVRA